MKFRFETLLKLNKIREGLQQKELGRINAHLHGQQDRLKFMEDIVEKSKRDYNEKINQELSLDSRVLYGNFFTGVKLEEKRQGQIISEIHTKQKVQLEKVIEAMRKRRTMEILKERDYKAFKKLQNKREVEFMDEVAAIQWRRNP